MSATVLVQRSVLTYFTDPRTHLQIAGNDTVPISVRRCKDVHSTLSIMYCMGTFVAAQQRTFVERNGDRRPLIVDIVWMECYI